MTQPRTTRQRAEDVATRAVDELLRRVSPLAFTSEDRTVARELIIDAIVEEFGPKPVDVETLSW